MWAGWQVGDSQDNMRVFVSSCPRWCYCLLRVQQAQQGLLVPAACTCVSGGEHQNGGWGSNAAP